MNGSVKNENSMRISRFLPVFVVAAFAVVTTAGAEKESPVVARLSAQLAEMNAQLDFTVFKRSYLVMRSPTDMLPMAKAGFEHATTHASVAIGGGDVLDAGLADYQDDAPTKAILDKRKQEMSNNQKKVTISDSGLRQINGFTYLWLQYHIPSTSPFSPTGKLHATLFSTVRDGWNHVVLALGDYEADSTNAAEDAVKSLSPLRPRGSPHPGTFEDYTGKIHGFETRLREDGWQKWVNVNTSFPGSFIGAHRGGASFVVALIFPLPARGLTIEENLNSVLRTCTRFANPEGKFKVEPVKLKGLDSALRFVTETDDDLGKTLFGGWFGQGAGRMMFTFCWSDLSKVTNAKTVLEGALGRVMPLEIDGMPAPSAFTTEQREMQGALLCDIAGQLVRRGRNEDAAEAFDMALRWSHTQISTLEAAVMGMQQIGDYKRADVLLRIYWDDFKNTPRAWLLRARLHGEAGEKDTAREDFAKAFELGLRDENAVIEYLAQLWTAERAKEALDFIEAYESKGESPRTARWRAAALARLKDYDRALPAYAKLMKLRPLDVEAALQYGEFANQAGKHDVAMEVVKTLLDEKQDGPRTRLIEGWASYGRKQWREAKLSFETARKLAPNDSLVLDALNSANAALGEGDSFAVKEAIEPLILPEAVRKRLEKEADAFKPGDESAVYLFSTTQIEYHAGKPTTITERNKIKIIDDSGVDAFSTIDLKFDPLSERIFVNQLEVLDEKGKIIAKGKLEDQYVTDPSIDGPATLGRVLRVPVPGLKPGRTLSYVFTKHTVDPEKQMRFNDIWFSSTYPTAAQAVVVQGELRGIQAQMNESMKSTAEIISDTDHNTRTWLLCPAHHLRVEPFLPRLSTFAPVLRLGAPEGDWKKTGAEYLKLIDEQLKPEPEIESLARTIVAGAKTNEEKIDLLSRHVRAEITYKAIEFGRRARIPNKPSRVAANHYGDCKDMSVLLNHLLRAVGIASHLALINARTDIEPGLPDLDQFNHMILHVPSLKSQFVDCTEGKSAGVDLPPTLFGLHAFVLDPAKPRLVEMPKREDWPANKMSVNRQVTFDSEGGADVTETVVLTSYLAQSMRMFLNSLQPQKRIDSMQAWQQRASHWQLDKLETENLIDPAQPLTLKLRYFMPPPALPGTKTVEIPGILEGEYLEMAHLRHRHHPYQVTHAMEITSEVHVTAVSRIDLASLKALTRSGEGQRHCKWTMKSEPKGDSAGRECTLTFHASMPGGSGKAAEYSEMRKAAAAAASAWHIPLRLQDL